MTTRNKGCDAVLVGIGVEIAQTLVQLGVDLTTLVTLADLQAGVAWAFARRRLRVVDFDRAPGAAADGTPLSTYQPPMRFAPHTDA